MSDSAETFDSLWAYCTANGRAVPRDWHKLYEMLANKRQKPSGGWIPSLPLFWRRGMSRCRLRSNCDSRSTSNGRATTIKWQKSAATCAHCQKTSGITSASCDASN